MNMEIFGLFDHDKSGVIEMSDLEEIGKAMGWAREESKLY
jgi:Ca2+-binding EF-hand superfamily protein